MITNFIPSADGVYYVGIKGFLNTSFNFISIDDISIIETPSCQNPLGLVSSNATTTSVELAWNTNADHESWEVEYGPVGFAQGSGTIVAANSNPFVLSGLSPSTTYQVYVRANCSGGTETSTWSNPTTFTTLCLTDVVLPYSQNFNSTAVGQVPLCWSRVLVSGTTEWQVGTTSNNSEITSNNEGNFIHKFYNDSESLLISNAVDLSAYAGEDLRLVFKNHRRSPAHVSDKVNWYVNSAPNLTGAILLQSFPSLLTETSPATTYSPAVDAVNSNGWYTYIMTFDSTIQTGSQVYFIAQGVTAGGFSSYGIAFDDFVVELVPATAPGCASNLVATQDPNCGNYQITVSWDAVSGADGYKVTAGTTSGGNDVADNLDLGAQTSVGIIAPTVNTTYYITVTPYNAVGDAVGCTEFSYTTPATGCYCPSVPTSVDANGISNVSINGTNFPNTNASYSYYQTPVVDLQQGVTTDVQITFQTGYTYNTNIWIDFNNDFSFSTTELVYSGESLSTNPTTLNASFTMPAGATLGQHRMRIGTADSGQFTPNPCYNGPWGVTIDFEVNILPQPSCLPPSALAVDSFSATSASLSWTASPSETGGYEWLLMNDGDDPLVGTPFASGTLPTGSTSATLNSLVTGNAYDFYIRSVCGASDLSDWVSVSFALTYCQPSSSSTSDYISLFSTTGAAGLNVNNSHSAITPGGYANYFASQTISHFAGGSFDFTNTFVGGTNGLRIWVDWGNDLSFDPSDVVFFLSNADLTKNGTITIPAGTPDGEYRMRVRAQWGSAASPDACGVISFGEAIDFKLLVDETLSSVKFDQLSLSLFPNPVNDILTVTNSEVLETVSIVNLLGQDVKSVKANDRQVQVNVSSLANGAYLLRATTADGRGGVIKFIKN